MIKGGFQGLDISDVDLTAASPSIPGGYAACAAADGKTMRVLTADGVVQCSVKKVSASYVLAGVTGDGKILGITITSTDGITVSETTVPAPYVPPVEYLDLPVDIGTATSSTPYTSQYDGLVYIINGNDSITNRITVVCKTGPTHANNTVILTIPISAGTGFMSTTFVKKGTILYCENVVSGVNARFIPYKPVS